MTLVINAVLAGPLLRKLGLADSSEARQRIVKSYTLRYRAAMIEKLVKLLCQNRFRRVNFALVKHHVPILQDLTKSHLLHAVAAHKATTHPEQYAPPFLKGVLPYLVDDTAGPHHEDLRALEEELMNADTKHERHVRISKRVKDRRQRRSKRYSTSNLRYMMKDDLLSAQELRILFISILKGTYDQQIEQGELDDAHVLAATLSQSLDLALDSVSNGGPLKDWEILYAIHQPLLHATDKLKNTFCATKTVNSVMWTKRGHLGLKANSDNMQIERSITFMAAHRMAQEVFMAELQNADSELTEAAKVVMVESKQQYDLAEAKLKEFDEKVLELAISHKFCKILLTLSVTYIERLVALGMLKETEAEPQIEEIEEQLDHVNSCDMAHHPGELEHLEDEDLSFYGENGLGVDPIVIREEDEVLTSVNFSASLSAQEMALPDASSARVHVPRADEATTGQPDQT